jgi:hypothetical protein
MRKLSGKQSITSLVMLLCLHLAAASLGAQEAYKIDEIRNPRCDLSEVPQITDPPPSGAIFAALDENKESKAAIVVYGRPGSARVYGKDVKRWLSEVRGVDADRLVTLYGGASDELRLELWLIPQGAPPPGVKPDEDYKSATLFDTYAYWDGAYCSGGRRSALAEFAEALTKRPDWRCTIVVRPHRNKRREREGSAGWDPDGYLSRRQALRRAVKDRRYLIKKFGLSAARVEAVVGDNDKWTHAELWLVPPGAESATQKAAGSIK